MNKKDEKETLKCLSYPVYEAPGKTVLFGEIVNREDFDKKQNCVPVNWPKPKVQFDRTCGIYASAISMEANGTVLFHLPENGINHSILKYPKKNLLQFGKWQKKMALRSLDLYSISLFFSKLLDCFKIKDTQILNLPKHGKGEPYIKAICDLLIKGNTIIIALDVKDGFPAKDKGHGCHWALIFGFIYLKKVKFLVTQYGGNYLWDGEALFMSNKLMPPMNPNEGIYVKAKLTTSIGPVSSYKKVAVVDEKTNLPKKYFRRIKETSLKNFRFTGLAVPAPALKDKVLEFNP